MTPISFISDAVFVAKSKAMGRGVFTKQALEKDYIIEIAPVIVMSGTERKLLDQTLLHDYIFEWGNRKKRCCMALGYVPVYNHSYDSNCEYEMEFDKEIISVRAVKNIEKGEELFINYNGVYNNPNKVWFETAR
jgi:hypothetical protein